MCANSLDLLQNVTCISLLWRVTQIGNVILSPLTRYIRWSFFISFDVLHNVANDSLSTSTCYISWQCVISLLWRFTYIGHVFRSPLWLGTYIGQIVPPPLTCCISWPMVPLSSLTCYIHWPVGSLSPLACYINWPRFLSRLRHVTSIGHVFLSPLWLVTIVGRALTLLWLVAWVGRCPRYLL